MKKFLLALLFSGSAFGADSVIPDEYLPYVVNFIIEAQEHNRTVTFKRLSIVSGSLPDEGAIGNCTTYYSGKKVLTIDVNRFYVKDEVTRQLVFFHELGHCVLDRNHSDSYKADGSPISIMNKYLIKKEEYEKDQKYYLMELFSK